MHRDEFKKKRSNVKPCGDKFKHFEGFHKRKNQKNKTKHNKDTQTVKCGTFSSGLFHHTKQSSEPKVPFYFSLKKQNKTKHVENIQI